MTVTFDVSDGFLADEGIWLNAEDLAFGFGRGYIDAANIIKVATRQAALNSDESAVAELALLLSDETSRVGPILASREKHVSDDHVPSPREKWLYLELKAAYLVRNRLDDPLGTVEQIYADFDYPPTLASFVRYMPIQQGHASGEQAQILRWGQYLAEESERLRAIEDGSDRP